MRSCWPTFLCLLSFGCASPGSQGASAPATDAAQGGQEAGSSADTPPPKGAPDASVAPELAPETETTPDIVCVPKCELRECGDDGCGGGCGDCPTGLACTTEGQCEVPPPTCPAPGPHGTKAGEVFPQVTFLDCAGNPVAVHDVMCDKEVSHLFILAGW
jgi:hypothetical protein